MAGESDGLSDRDRAMLDFEKQWFRYQGVKEDAIRDLFDMTPIRYFQILNAILDRPEALAYSPVVVNRLRRVRRRHPRVAPR